MRDEVRQHILEGEKSQAVRRKLGDRTRQSYAVRSSGQKSLAQEIVQTVDLPHPLYIDRCEGAYMWDVDDNRYIDLTGGFGPLVLGHRHPSIQQAVEAQIRKGWHIGLPSPLQPALSDLLQQAGRCVENVVFCNSGTEATMYAMRAARAFTGKMKAALFDGSYHGAHDYALVKADVRSDRDRPRARIQGAGVPPQIADETMLVLPYRNSTTFDLIREHKDELAVVLIEPVQSSNPRLDCKEFLHELKQVCQDCGVLLLFDEVITGFRIEWGGCQDYYDITPDLATYGKALGGGMPIGAVGGRKDIMQVFSGKGAAPAIFSGGTFSGNPLTMAAGVAAVSYMRDHKDEIYPYLMQQSNHFAERVNDFCRQNQFPAQVMHAGSMFHLVFTPGEIRSSRDLNNERQLVEQEFYLHLLGYDVIIPGIHLAFFSTAHTPEQVDQVVDAFMNSFMDLRHDRLL